MLTWRTSCSLVAAAAAATGCASRVTPIGAGFIYEPDKREQRLWRTTREQSAEIQNAGALYDDPRLHAYVQSVLNRLLGDYKNAYSPLEARVFILDSESVNAFALPHGDIYVHKGILGRIRNEAQLAMLLGHELTHNTHRHLYQEYEHAYASTGTYSYIAVLGALGGGNVQQAIEGLSRLVTLAAISGYSRDKEEEADEVGLTLAAQAGYDPREGAKMFQRMLDASDRKDRGWSFFYASHPKMKKRVKSCNKLIERLPPELLSNAKELGEDRYLDAAIGLIHDEVERHIIQGKYELAEETLAFLSKARPSDPDTHALRGELFRARGDDGDGERSRKAYTEALELDGQHAIAHRGLGLLLVRLGDKDEAVVHLRKYISVAPDAADVTYIRQYIDRLTRGD
jgi:predicted Zn-dependent protease